MVLPTRCRPRRRPRPSPSRSTSRRRHRHRPTRPTRHTSRTIRQHPRKHPTTTRRRPVMAGEPYITVVGNLAGDPELRFTSSGHAVASFTIAQTPRSYDKATQQHVDDETLWVRCTVWREAAENVAETLTKGMRVIAHGRLNARSFETKSGEQRTNWELTRSEERRVGKGRTARCGGGRA